MERTSFNPVDVELLYDNLRPTDHAYLKAVYKRDVFVQLEESFCSAEKTYTFWNEGKVVALMGCTGNNVFLQTNSLTDGKAEEVIRIGREAVGLFSKHPMVAVVPRDDKRVRKLCDALGFTELTDGYENYNASGIPHVALWRRNE